MDWKSIIQHILVLSVNLDDILLELRHIGHVVILPFSLLFLEFDGESSHGAACCGEAWRR